MVITNQRCRACRRIAKVDSDKLDMLNSVTGFWKCKYCGLENKYK